MKTSHYVNLPIRCNVDQTVRESTKSRAAKLSPYCLILEGAVLDRHQHRVHGVNKIGTQSRAPLVIPIPGFGDFGFGLWSKDQLAVHL